MTQKDEEVVLKFLSDIENFKTMFLNRIKEEKIEKKDYPIYFCIDSISLYLDIDKTNISDKALGCLNEIQEKFNRFLSDVGILS